MIPKYPFFVTVYRKIGNGKLDMRQKAFETLDAAHAFGNTILRSSDVKRVQITCILDDTRKNETGDVLGFSHEAQP